MKRLSILVAILGLVACGAAPVESDATVEQTTVPQAPPPTAQPPTTLPTSPPSPTSPTNTEEPGDIGSTTEHDIVEAAMADLAGRLAVPSETVTVLSFEWVTWNDGSLGCPQPGMVYTQALVEGSRAVLSVEGVSYSYHAGRGGRPSLCENPSVKPGLDPGTSLTVPRADA